MEEPEVEVRKSGVNVRISILGVVGASIALGGTVVGLTKSFTDIGNDLASHSKRITALEEVTDASMLERLDEVEIIFDDLPPLRERLSLIEAGHRGMRDAILYFHFPEQFAIRHPGQSVPQLPPGEMPGMLPEPEPEPAAE